MLSRHMADYDSKGPVLIVVCIYYISIKQTYKVHVAKSSHYKGCNVGGFWWSFLSFLYFFLHLVAIFDLVHYVNTSCLLINC